MLKSMFKKKKKVRISEDIVEILNVLVKDMEFRQLQEMIGREI